MAETTLQAQPIAGDNELPWQQEMGGEYQRGVENVHQFILYFNVHDYVFTSTLAKPGWSPQRLRDYLGCLLKQRGFSAILYYSRSGGLVPLEEGMQETLQKGIPKEVRHGCRQYGQTGQEDAVRPLHEPIVAFSYLDRILTWCPPSEEAKAQQLPRIALIVEYLENLAPNEDSPSPSPEAQFVVETLHRWALDERIRGNRHLIVMLTADLGRVASILTTASSECRCLRVDLPNQEERRIWLEWVHADLQQRVQRTREEKGEKAVCETWVCPDPLAPAEALKDLNRLAAQTAGFNYDNLRDLVYYATRQPQGLTLDVVRQRKREVITAESRDLLEIVEPTHGFEAIAGYEHAVELLKLIRDAMQFQTPQNQLARLVPKGILFLGPPGTGKSYLAAALAKEVGFNLVKLRNIRSMWLGESERNLNRVLDLLTAMAPVIAFVDEVDQALGRRQAGPTTDGAGGVERRIFQRILEFMAQDEHRGRVLWIAASNRPDEIDVALMSRFDVIIPFLLPDARTRRQMVERVYPGKIGYTFQCDDEAQMEELVERTAGFSGRELDTLCRRALQVVLEDRLQALRAGASGPASLGGNPADDQDFAQPVVEARHLEETVGDYRMARDQIVYELQTLLAIQATSFYRFLPDRGALPEEIRAPEGKFPPLDEGKLQERIDELRARVGAYARPGWPG